MRTKIILLFILIMNVELQAKTINVMLLSGQTDKYHNWEVTSAHLNAILDQEKRFSTHEVHIPAAGKAFDEFVPDFANYDVVVLNLNLAEWNNKAKAAFETYVKRGGGIVVVHEANNAFPNWKEYNRITGLGGWAGRSEKDGPYYYWKDGDFVKDNSPGPGGAHGDRVPYVVNIRDTEHTITNGLPMKWLHQNDELYGNLRGPAENIQVLATAFSDKRSGGTGKEEPVLFTITYGKGRIFQTVMGHTSVDFSDSMQDVGFQVTFLRGVEWAATGKVRQKLPKEFPTETSVLLNDLVK